MAERYTTELGHQPCLTGHTKSPHCSRGQGQHYCTSSKWERLSAEERLRKKKVWEQIKSTLHHFEIPPFSTPPRNAEEDVSLEDDMEEEDQEVLEDLEQEEKEDKETTEDDRGEDFVPYCVYCDSNICYCKDKQQVTLFI